MQLYHNMDKKMFSFLFIVASATAMSTPPLTQVVAPAGSVIEPKALQAQPAESNQQEQSAASTDDQGFMQDIGFGHFFRDVGLQSSASHFEGIGAHPGPQFTVGVASSNQHKVEGKETEDPSVKGFIPSNPLSFGEYTSPSGASATSFVSSSSPSFAGFQPSHAFANNYQASEASYVPSKPAPQPKKRPVYKQPSFQRQPPSHPTYDEGRPAHDQDYKERQPSRPQYHERQPAHDQDYQERQPSRPQYHERRPAHDQDYQERQPSRPQYHERRPAHDDYQDRQPSRPEYHDQDSQERRPYAEEHYASSEEQPESEYTYAPTHQEKRRRPSYSQDDRDDQSYDSSDDYEPRRPHYQDDERRYSPDERSESRPKVQYREQGPEEKESDGKCKEVEKDGMTCEVCDDGDGGYSEHCSHSTRRGKDRLYSNSKRGGFKDFYPTGHGGRGKPRQSEARPNPVYVPRTSASNSFPNHQSSPYRDNSYQPEEADPFHIGYSSPVSTKTESQRRVDDVYAAPSYVEDFGRDDKFDPFNDDSKYDPYTFGDALPSETKDDYKPDFGLHDHGHDSFDDFGDYGHKDDDDYGSDHDNDGLKKSETQKKPVYSGPVDFATLDHENNFTELTKLMKDFKKKDRTSCKKVEKEGMTCYVCPDPHGMEDEECLYSGNDPNGHQIMYSEETTY